MSYLYLLAALCGFIVVLCTLDIALRTMVDERTIERWTDRIFR